MEESEPNRMTNMFVDHPCKTICCGYLLLFLLCFIAIKFNFFDINTDQGREWFVWDDPITRDFEKYTLADTYIDENSGKSRLDVRAAKSGIMILIYEKKTDSATGMIDRSYF